VTTRERRISWDPRVGTVGNSDALNSEKLRGSIQTLECPPAARRKYRRLAYTDCCKVDAGNRETHSVKNVETCKKNVGAWCWIGGCQGALSQACKETGVACIPCKRLDYSNVSERKHCSGSYQSSAIARWKRTLRESMKVEEGRARTELPKGCSAMNETRWMWEPGVGGWQPGDTDSSDLRSRKWLRIRGSLHTRASRLLARRESKSGQLERPKSSQEP